MGYLIRFKRTVWDEVGRIASGLLMLGALFAFASGVTAAELVCAEVKIEIKQELTLERQAFDAMMRINNALTTLSLEHVNVNVHFQDENGNDVLATSDPSSTDPNVKFFIRVDSLDGISDVSGTGSVAPTSSAEIHWLIIPVPGAAEGSPSGKLYFVGATLSYTLGGELETVEVTPDFITVKPLPQLALDYFLTQEVIGDDAFTTEIEPPEPYTLGVRIRNNGTGWASSVKIDSAQPKIVENEQGLLIGFQITGSTLNDQPAQPTLLIDFGDIQPGASTVGRWIMETTLSGEFVDFTARVSHADELGGQVTSIIDSNAIDTHFLIRDVRVDLPGRDKVRDFLAYPAGSSANSLSVYESETVDTPVTDQSATASLALSAQSGDELYHTLKLPVTDGFVYGRLPDPYAGQKVIKEVVRSDGKVIPLDNAWTSKTRNRDTNPPSWEYWIHLFDANTTGTYAVRMGEPTLGPLPPVLQTIADRVTHEGKQVGFLVEASDPNGDIPKLSAPLRPVGALFVDNGNGTGYLDWTPDEGQAGSYSITYKASDAVLYSTRTASIRVNPAWDTDGDGMADDWELEHFGTLDRDGTGDFDGDGISDLQEYLDGTDPTVADLPGLPGIESPRDGSEVTEQKPQLVILNSEHGPEVTITYELELYQDAGFTELVVGAKGLVETPDTTAWQDDVVLEDNRWYYWRVRAQSGQIYSPWVNGRFFVNTANDVPGAFAVSSPQDNAMVSTFTPVLAVSNSTDVDGDVLNYAFAVFADSTLAMPVASVTDLPPGAEGTTAWTVDTPLIENSQYYWRATVTDAHGAEAQTEVASFMVNTSNEAPSEPAIEAPAHGGEVSAQEVLLSVTNATDPEGDALVYYFELDTVESFDSAAKRVSSGVAEGLESTAWRVAELQDNTRYYWRAKASDGSAESGWVQGGFFVNTANDAPSTPVIDNPGHEAWVESRIPTLKVHPSTDVDGDRLSYHFELYSDRDLIMLVDQSVMDTGTWSVGTPLLDNRWYYWQVRAEDEEGAASAWTSVSSFFVNEDGVDDPPQITLLEPASEVLVTSSTVTIRWSDEDPDSGATISLYYDRDDAGYDGVLLQEGIAEDLDEAGDALSWDLSQLPEGSYYVYAVIEDETNSVQGYAPGYFAVGLGENDMDYDGDGVSNEEDAFPLNPDEWQDSDGDGKGDNADADDDNDGVGDVIDSAPLDPSNSGPVVALEQAVQDNGEHGWLYGQGQHKSVLAAVFESDGKDRLLHVQGYDIDDVDEVGVHLNGQLLGYLSPGPNEAYNRASLWWLPVDLQAQGENRVELRQKTPGRTWGVRNLATHPLGVAFGNLRTLEGGDVSHEDGFELHLLGAAERLLEIQGYDSDFAGEIQVELNGQPYARLPKGVDKGWTQSYELVLESEDLSVRDNVLVFSNQDNPIYDWGLGLMALRPLHAPLGQLQTLLEQERLTDQVNYLLPESEQPRYLSLSFYDIDLTREVHVLIQGTAQGYAKLTSNDSWGSVETLPIDSHQSTVVEVRNIHNPPNAYWWGVRLESLEPIPDTDEDGTWDHVDADDDDDGVPDTADAFPLDPSEWLDTDKDSIGNNADLDDDNDAVEDAEDSAPLDRSNTGSVVRLTDAHASSGEYGWRYGSSEHFSTLAATFESDGADRLLHVQGYDIDKADEVSVYLNGRRLGYLSPGPNHGYNPPSLWWLPAALQQAGLNRIEFRQKKPGWKWGLRWLSIDRLGMALGNLRTLSGGDRSHADGVELHIPGDAGYLLALRAYDSDRDGEIQVELSGLSYLGLPQGTNNAWTAEYQLILPAQRLQGGDNILYLRNSLNPAYNWGVQLVALRALDAQLGHFPGRAEAEQQTNAALYLLPAEDFGRDLLLRYYDVDNAKELQVLVDGVEVGYARPTANNAWGTIATVALAPGESTVVEINATGNPPNTWRWGVQLVEFTVRERDDDFRTMPMYWDMRERSCGARDSGVHRGLGHSDYELGRPKCRGLDKGQSASRDAGAGYRHR